jgi:hypothetical protein
MDGVKDGEIIDAVREALEQKLKAQAFDLVRLRQDYSIDQDKIKVRMEFTFEY